MLPYSLSETDAASVNMERKTQTSLLIRDRMQVLHFLHLGLRRQECARLVGCHINSVTNYIKMYQRGGLDLIRQTAYQGSKHELQSQYSEVDKVLTEQPCSTVAQAAKVLQDRFGYYRSVEAVRNLLYRLGFRRRKTGTFPGRAKDFDKWQAQQEAFIKHLEALMQCAEKEEIDLVFGDAAHFVYGKFNQYHWGKAPGYVPSGHGRYRINVYGVYDVRSQAISSMYNEGYINAQFMAEYLQWLRKQVYVDQDRPLHIVLDNARYQHCNYVKDLAHDLNIVLEFLPGYSPNLNLIERLWKYMKGILGGQYRAANRHDNKTSFEEAIVNILKNLNRRDHQEKLRTLLSPKFQKFEKSQILPW